MKKLITILSLAVVGFAFAQEQEPTFTVSGSIDAYFRTNLTSSNDGGVNTILGEQGDFSAFNRWKRRFIGYLIVKQNLF